MLHIFEFPTGKIDGINKIFRLKNNYKKYSLHVFLNGVLINENLEEGWFTTTSNKFVLLEAPLEGDIVGVYYSPI